MGCPAAAAWTAPTPGRRGIKRGEPRAPRASRSNVRRAPIPALPTRRAGFSFLGLTYMAC
jgi:hypothetical protein